MWGADSRTSYSIPRTQEPGGFAKTGGALIRHWMRRNLGGEVTVPDLWKKLNLKDQDPILVLNPPESFNDHLKEVAPRTVYSAAGKVKEVEFFLAFVKTLKDVERATAWVAKKTQGDSVVWMAYPKQTSKKYNCEFNRDTGWDALEKIGLRGVRQVAIDEDWSALRFRRCEYIK